MTTEEIKEMKAVMAADKSGNRKFWSPPAKVEGTFPIRILPPLKKNGEKVFYFSHLAHWLAGTSYECLSQTIVDEDKKLHESEPCPVCQFVKKLYATAERDTDEWKLASNLRAKSRYVYRIVARNSENFKNENEEIPVFYETGKTIFDIIYHVITETKFGVIVDPKDGRDFNIVKNGTGRQSRYDQSMPEVEISQIFDDPQKIRTLFENAMKMNYSSLIKFVSYDYLDKELKESIGIITKSEPVKNEEIKPQESSPQESSHLNDTDSEEPAEKNEDNEIENILNEFV